MPTVAKPTVQSTANHSHWLYMNEQLVYQATTWVIHWPESVELWRGSVALDLVIPTHAKVSDSTSSW